MSYTTTWVDLFIQMISGTFQKLFQINIINTQQLQISLGQCFLYFAIASIVLSFIFNVRISGDLLAGKRQRNFERGRREGFNQGRSYGYERGFKDASE